MPAVVQINLSGYGNYIDIPAIVAFPGMAIALYLIGLACRYVLNPEGKK